MPSGDTSDVLVQQSCHDGRIEIAAVARRGVEEDVLGEGTELVLEPVIDGDAEAHLWPVDDLVGNDAT